MDWIDGVLFAHALEKAYDRSKCSANEEYVGKEQVDMRIFRTEAILAINAVVLRNDLNDGEDELGKRILQRTGPGPLESGSVLHLL